MLLEYYFYKCCTKAGKKIKKPVDITDPQTESYKIMKTIAFTVRPAPTKDLDLRPRYRSKL